jgi:predicted peptidase
MAQTLPLRDDPNINPNSLHQYHVAKRGPKGVPENVTAVDPGNARESTPKDPGHSVAVTNHVSFDFYDQRRTNAPFGYEHFVSLPPAYESDTSTKWPLILFLHGSGESQHSPGDSYASIRHGIPKVILCYDKLAENPDDDHPSVDIPMQSRMRKNNPSKQGDKSSDPVPAETCRFMNEHFITVSPSLNMTHGYGWSAPILSALLDEIVERYRINVDRIHLTGFSMGGYGVWDLALREPNRFASLMPICGGADPAQAETLKHILTWIHHGEKDDIVPAKASQLMYDALLAAGSQDVRFECYKDMMHDSWTVAYNNLEVYRWMLKCKRT